jgi:hypothetical protein
MAIASGIEKKLVLAPQAAKGTCAVANLATAQYLRRVTSTLDVTKDTYQSNEMRSDRQIGDFRHGAKSISGSISGELSPGTYAKLFAAILRKAWAAGVEMDVAGTDNCAAANTATATGTFTRDDVDGSWLKDGFKVGDVVRFTGWDTPATANNAHNFLITALTATIMTVIGLDGVGPVTRAKGDSVACSVTGYKCWTPTTGHTEDWFSIEHNYSDVDLSEVFWDLKINSLAVKLPATGMATIDMGFMGLNSTNYAAGAAPYFSAVLAASTSGCLAAVNGVIYVEGTKIALITGMDFDIAGNLSSDPVIGTNTKPDIFDGRVVVKGNLTVYFEDATFRDYFENESEVTISIALTTTSAAKADFIAFTFPRCKVGGASKDDGEKGVIQTLPFQALFDTSAGADTGATATATLATTMSIQDSTVTS